MSEQHAADWQEFLAKVADAYSHLYDLVGLRSHPLTEILVPTSGLDRKEKAWRIHHLLLEAIDELDPGPRAPAFSHEWRRHRLMVLHYVDGVDPQAVADRLAISRRQYYREHDAAIDAAAAILWERRQAHPMQPGGIPPVDKLEMLRLEVARTAQAHRYTRLSEVVSGVLALLEAKLRERQLAVHASLPDGLPALSLDRNLLRQLLLGVLGFLIDHTRECTLHLWAERRDASVLVRVLVRRVAPHHQLDEGTIRERIAAWTELAGLGGASVALVAEAEGIGFELSLPAGPRRPVLVVDDNEDVLELFQRYLASRYPVVTARSGEEALVLARQLQPHAITLDLMMPGRDGWDVLQALLTQPETRHIPVVVCSVLRERELALSLGATAFLEKPVTEQSLISALERLSD